MAAFSNAIDIDGLVSDSLYGHVLYRLLILVTCNVLVLRGWNVPNKKPTSKNDLLQLLHVYYCVIVLHKNLVQYFTTNINSYNHARKKKCNLCIQFFMVLLTKATAETFSNEVVYLKNQNVLYGKNRHSFKIWKKCIWKCWKNIFLKAKCCLWLYSLFSEKFLSHPKNGLQLWKLRRMGTKHIFCYFFAIINFFCRKILFYLKIFNSICWKSANPSLKHTIAFVLSKRFLTQ